MAEDLRTYRTSRKRRRCDSFGWNCRKWIEQGERYLRAALPPNSDLGNKHWWTMNICKGCMSLEDLNNV